jgi:hypothetical protein
MNSGYCPFDDEGKPDPVGAGTATPDGTVQLSPGRSFSRLSSIPMMKPAQRAVRVHTTNQEPVERPEFFIIDPQV